MPDFMEQVVVISGAARNLRGVVSLALADAGEKMGQARADLRAS